MRPALIALIWLGALVQDGCGAVYLLMAIEQKCEMGFCQRYRAYSTTFCVGRMPDGTLVYLAAGHAVKPAIKLEIGTNAGWLPARVRYVAYDKNEDIAVLTTDATAQIKAIAVSDREPPIGDAATICGFPGPPSRDPQRYQGRIGISDSRGNAITSQRSIYVDRTITQGVSGAPVIWNGQAVGVATRVLSHWDRGVPPHTAAENLRVMRNALMRGVGEIPRIEAQRYQRQRPPMPPPATKLDPPTVGLAPPQPPAEAEPPPKPQEYVQIRREDIEPMLEDLKADLGRDVDRKLRVHSASVGVKVDRFLQEKAPGYVDKSVSAAVPPAVSGEFDRQRPGLLGAVAQRTRPIVLREVGVAATAAVTKRVGFSVPSWLGWAAPAIPFAAPLAVGALALGGIGMYLARKKRIRYYARNGDPVVSSQPFPAAAAETHAQRI